MVFACDDAALQSVLPTVLLVSEKLVSMADFQRLLHTLPSHVTLWRQKRAWVTGATMVRACRLLACALEPWRSEVEFIVSADTYGAHLTKAVWKAMSRLRFTYMLIPSRLTWCLQPCDTHIFAPYKRRVSVEFQARQIAIRGVTERALSLGAPPTGRMFPRLACLLEALCAAFESEVRRKSWAHAFASNGLGRSLSDISPNLLQQVGLSAPPIVEAQILPSLRDFESIFPRNRDIPLDAIFAFACRTGEAAIAPAGRRWAGHDDEHAPVRRRSTLGSEVEGTHPAIIDRPPCPMGATMSGATAAPHRLLRIPRARRLGPPPTRRH